jgi:hypothetical protein
MRLSSLFPPNGTKMAERLLLNAPEIFTLFKVVFDAKEGMRRS